MDGNSCVVGTSDTGSVGQWDSVVGRVHCSLEENNFYLTRNMISGNTGYPPANFLVGVAGCTNASV